MASIQSILADNVGLRAENRTLRKRLHDRHGRIIRQSERDALTLLRLRWAGEIPTRKHCRTLGISERRWQWAVALLRLSGVYGISDVYRLRERTIVRYDVRPGVSLDNAIAMVRGRVRGLLERPDGLEVLRARNGRYRVTPQGENVTHYAHARGK